LSKNLGSPGDIENGFFFQQVEGPRLLDFGDQPSGHDSILLVITNIVKGDY